MAVAVEVSGGTNTSYGVLHMILYLQTQGNRSLKVDLSLDSAHWEQSEMRLLHSSSGPKFQVSPHNVSTYEGVPVTIPCSTEKAQDTFTVWRKAGRPLYQDDATTIATNGSLIIQRPKVNHSGTYNCMAVSEKGVAMATIYIEILTRPGTVELLDL